jgi:hypothetical protein
MTGPAALPLPSGTCPKRVDHVFERARRVADPVVGRLRARLSVEGVKRPDCLVPRVVDVRTVALSGPLRKCTALVNNNPLSARSACSINRR